MVVAQTSTTTTGYDELLAVLCHLANDFIRIGVTADTSQRHIKYLIGTLTTCPQIIATVLSVFSKDVLGVLEVQECPALGVATQNDVPPPTAVTPVRTSLGVVFDTKQVG